MADILKQVSLAGKYKAEARLADLAAKEMARHCDKRVNALLKVLKNIANSNLTPGRAMSAALQMRRVASEAVTADVGGSGHD